MPTPTAVPIVVSVPVYDMADICGVVNLPGGTILAGFLFQNRYNNCATCCCLGTREAAGGHDARRRLMGYRTDLQAWVSQHNCAL